MFQKTNGMLKADEPHTFGFPSTDITISQHEKDASRSKLWRDRDAFGEVFIRVVCSLACNLSIEATVRVLTETQKLTGSIGKYPHAVVSSGHGDSRQWCTIGPPIWTSLSFLGRGTNVWHVREYVVGVTQEPSLRENVMVMKTAWRSSARTPESDIYMSIDKFHEGLAKFECGGEVKHAGYPITVQNLRNPVNIVRDINPPTPPTPVLHRLIPSTVGRPPLWDYTSDFHLLARFRNAIQGECNQLRICDHSDSFLITFQRTRPRLIKA
jgi:hypothetical protein